VGTDQIVSLSTLLTSDCDGQAADTDAVRRWMSIEPYMRAAVAAGAMLPEFQRCSVSKWFAPLHAVAAILRGLLRALFEC